MATAEQIKALLRSHADRDDPRFYSIALQVAAQEARQGHHKLASDMKAMVEKSQAAANLRPAASKPTPLIQQPKGDLKGLLELTHAQIRGSELVLVRAVRERLDQGAFGTAPKGQACSVRSFCPTEIAIHGITGHREDDVRCGPGN